MCTQRDALLREIMDALSRVPPVPRNFVFNEQQVAAMKRHMVGFAIPKGTGRCCGCKPR